MNATAIIVTRGDADLREPLHTIPEEWQTLVWDNGSGRLLERSSSGFYSVVASDLPDLAVYGRYAALDYALNDVIYVQDDDVVVSEPVMIALAADALRFADGSLIDAVVCNMPQEFRHDFYDEHALSGFGCAFPRSLPGRTFVWFKDRATLDEDVFNRTCDIVFTGLTQRVLVDYPIRSLPIAHADNRMWKQTTHVGERTQVLEIVKTMAADAQWGMRNAPVGQVE